MARTDGVPLFVEELTKTVLESGLLATRATTTSWPALPPLAIPATLHDSLMARLDRFAPVKEVAQIGAAIGREFSHELLAAVADRPRPACKAPWTSSSLPSWSSAAAAARRDLQIQARAGPGRRQPKPAQKQAPAPARPNRPGDRGGISDVDGTQPEVLARHFTDGGPWSTGDPLLVLRRRACRRRARPTLEAIAT